MRRERNLSHIKDQDTTPEKEPYKMKAADKGTIVSSKIFLKQILNMLTLLNVDGESMYVNTIVISNL